jgi:hypothetical protein
MDPSTDPGATATPPVEPSAPVEPSTGSEPVTNTEVKPEHSVPFDRFQEVNDKAKEAEEKVRVSEARIAELEAQQTRTPSDEDIELEPDTEKLLDSYVKKHGFVSQQDLAAERNKIQVQQDIRDLTDQYAKSGIPFEDKKIFDYAKQNNLPITSKSALDAAYKQMNWDKLVETERQRAIDQFKSGNSSSGEKPGSSAPTTPEEPQTGNLRSRIRAAHQKLNA